MSFNRLIRMGETKMNRQKGNGFKDMANVCLEESRVSTATSYVVEEPRLSEGATVTSYVAEEPRLSEGSAVTSYVAEKIEYLEKYEADVVGSDGEKSQLQDCNPSINEDECDFLLKDDDESGLCPDFGGSHEMNDLPDKYGFYLSPAFCVHNKVCLIENGTKVVVGLCDDNDYQLKKRIRRVFEISEFSGRKLEFVKLSEEQCCRSIARLLADEEYFNNDLRGRNPADCIGGYDGKERRDIEKKASESFLHPDSACDEQEVMQTELSGSPAVNILDSVMIEALSSNVSDIHLEPVFAEDGKKSLVIRFRKDGELFVYKSFDFSLLEPVLVRIKILAGLKTEENRRPQDGRFLWRNSNFSADVRVSIIPLWNGESAVLRLLRTASSPVNLLELGFSSCHVNDFNWILSLRNNLVLVAGPTGAGKTTTIAGMVSRLASERRKIITIEDPVEYRIPGVTQIEVKPGIKFDFEDALRHVFRHDPDVLMIGEIRDVQTAATAVRAAVTGHLVLATVHASGACSAVIRLLDMGVEPYILASVFGAAVAQCLVPSVAGGRTVIAEILRGTEDVRRLIANKPTVSEIASCMRSHGMVSMREDFEYKKALGIIDAGSIAEGEWC